MSMSLRGEFCLVISFAVHLLKEKSLSFQILNQSWLFRVGKSFYFWWASFIIIAGKRYNKADIAALEKRAVDM